MKKKRGKASQRSGVLPHSEERMEDKSRDNEKTPTQSNAHNTAMQSVSTHRRQHHQEKSRTQIKTRETGACKNADMKKKEKENEGERKRRKEKKKRKRKIYNGKMMR